MFLTLQGYSLMRSSRIPRQAYIFAYVFTMEFQRQLNAEKVQNRQNLKFL